MSQNNVFDGSYVGSQQTAPLVENKSAMKDFLKSPVSQDDIDKYGSSKPKRIVIRATIQHGQS